MGERINPKQEYSITDIKKAGLFPWVKNHRTLKKIIMTDFFGQNVMKAKIKGEGRQARYFVRGENITKFIKIYGPYLYRTVRRSTHGKINRSDEGSGGEGGERL